jgi:phosphate acetyltransferase
VTLKATRKFDHNHHIIFDCLCTNQDGLKVIAGTAEVLAPTEKIKRERIAMPEVTLLDREARYQHLLDRTKGMSPVLMAVAHPCDAVSLGGVVTAAEAGLIVPILVGRRGRSAPSRANRRSTSRRWKLSMSRIVMTPRRRRSRWCAPAAPKR